MQELFFIISHGYFNGSATNYLFLLDRFRGKWQELIWLNLNYDLFADRALREHLKDPSQLNRIEEYMGLETKDGLRIKYTKPHGSVDWVRKFKDKGISESTIRNGEAPENFLERLEGQIYHKQGGQIVGGDEGFLFPVISIPTGKYDFVYSDHKIEIENDVKEINSLLCIGFSALDEDILKILKNMPEIRNLLIINGSYDAGRKVLKNMREFGVQISHAIGGDDNVGIYHSGFSSFIANEKEGQSDPRVRSIKL